MPEDKYKKRKESLHEKKDNRRYARANRKIAKADEKGKGDKARKKYGYDYSAAIAAGITPGKDGHWATRNPDTGEYFKGRKHPTVYKSKKVDRKMDYKIKRKDGRLYSYPKK
ncbi:MAG: hypothetical protein ACW980_21765 [Promethearchaeota archaeon]|jgi:hypothetical protein